VTDSGAGVFVWTRILIADDRESMRIALRALIRMRPDWQICGEAEDGREVVAKSSRTTTRPSRFGFQDALRERNQGGQ